MSTLFETSSMLYILSLLTSQCAFRQVCSIDFCALSPFRSLCNARVRKRSKVRFALVVCRLFATTVTSEFLIFSSGLTAASIGVFSQTPVKRIVGAPSTEFAVLDLYGLVGFGATSRQYKFRNAVQLSYGNHSNCLPTSHIV